MCCELKLTHPFASYQKQAGSRRHKCAGCNE